MSSAVAVRVCRLLRLPFEEPRASVCTEHCQIEPALPGPRWALESVPSPASLPLLWCVSYSDALRSAPGCRDSSPGCLLGQGFWCVSRFTQLAGTPWGRPRVCVHWEREPGHVPQWPVGQEPPHSTPGQTPQAICSCAADRAAPTCGLQARRPAVWCVTAPSLSVWETGHLFFGLPRLPRSACACIGQSDRSHALS